MALLHIGHRLWRVDAALEELAGEEEGALGLRLAEEGVDHLLHSVDTLEAFHHQRQAFDGKSHHAVAAVVDDLALALFHHLWQAGNGVSQVLEFLIYYNLHFFLNSFRSCF